MKSLLDENIRHNCTNVEVFGNTTTDNAPEMIKRLFRKLQIDTCYYRPIAFESGLAVIIFYSPSTLCIGSFANMRFRYWERSLNNNGVVEEQCKSSFI